MSTNPRIDGDIEEMVDELNSGKIMYAYMKVIDPNTGLNKFVLVNWQGEGVPENKKGMCASHFNDVRNFLKGAHLTIQARSEDDLDEEDILNKVSKSSGSNYSVHKEVSKPIPEAKPVGSVYKKTLPHAEIRPQRRDQFWEKQEEEEKQRRNMDQQRRADEIQKCDHDRRTREEQEEVEREKRESERMKKVRDMKAHEKRANAPDQSAEKQRWEASQVDALKDEDERRKRSDMMRKERQAETQQLIQQRENNPRAVFQRRKSQFDDEEQNEPQSKPVRKLQHGFGQNQQSEDDQRKQPIQLPKAEPDFDRPNFSSNAAASQPPASLPARSQPPRSPSPVEEAPQRPPPVPAARTSDSQRPVSNTVGQVPQARNLLAEALPQRQDSDEEEEDEEAWGDEEEQPAVRPPAIVASIPQQPRYEPEPEPEQTRYEPEPEQTRYESEPEQTRYEPEPQQQQTYDDSDPSAQTEDKGVCATALYDYQAADDTEVTFDPDDIITNIDMIDEGWWQGMAPDGTYGMFPANYVELIE